MTSLQTTDDLGLRERKKKETRRQIRRAALDLAIEHGLENLTVEDIASGAGISPRTFFNYFTHKEDAFVTDATDAAESIRSHVAARPADETPLHAIRATITGLDFFDLMNSDRDRTLARQQLVSRHPVLLARQLNQHVVMEQAIARAVAERTGTSAADDLRPSLIASVAGAAVRMALRRWSTHSGESLDELLVEAFDLLERGLLTDETSATVHPTPAQPSTQEGATAHRV